jgi:hypothetical protein
MTVVWILFWIALAIVLALLLLWLLTRLGVPCVFCEVFGSKKPEFGSDRAPPKRGSIRIPSDIYKRPDPLIYSQYFLMAQGLAVTWDNPDIWLEKVDPANPDKPSGIVVPSHEVNANVEYFVVARIWNGSVDAPAVDLPVVFSYLTFGIGITSTAIGTTKVDLPAKGLPGCPALANIKWRTPPTAGHYCLQVLLIWPDDAEPGNNLGQENVNVKALNSPHAAFDFPVRNATRNREQIRLEADAYTLRARPRCEPKREPVLGPSLTPQEIARQRRNARTEHGKGNFPLPPGWQVKLIPAAFVLAPGETRMVTADVTAPDGFKGEQVINVHAFMGEQLLGGVTLRVTGDGH